VKLFVSFKYNANEIIERVLESDATEIENIATSNHEVLALRQLIMDSVFLTLTYTTEWRENFEAEINEAFPNIKTIDLELVKLEDSERIDGPTHSTAS
jgi:hypothetical protein